MRVIVVIPTYNERDNIVEIVQAVRTNLPEANVLVVDDGSPDGTGRLVAEMGADPTPISGCCSGAASSV